MCKALLFLEHQLKEEECPIDDTEVLHVAEQTYNQALFDAEQEFFSQKILAEILSRPSQKILDVLCFDLGGLPTFFPALLSRLRQKLRSEKSIRLVYVRLDPNTAGCNASKKALKPFEQSTSTLTLRTLFAKTSPEKAVISPKVWNVLQQRFDILISLLPGGCLNAIGDGVQDKEQQKVIRGFLRNSDLNLTTLLCPDGFLHLYDRLLEIRNAGAHFDELCFTICSHVSSQKLLLEKEHRISLEKNLYTQTKIVALFHRCKQMTFPSYVVFGVALKNGPTRVLARIFSERYLREVLLSGFAFPSPTPFDEAWLTTLRYIH